MNSTFQRGNTRNLLHTKINGFVHLKSHFELLIPQSLNSFSQKLFFDTINVIIAAQVFQIIISQCVRLKGSMPTAGRWSKKKKGGGPQETGMKIVQSGRWKKDLKAHPSSHLLLLWLLSTRWSLLLCGLGLTSILCWKKKKKWNKIKESAR